jgi:hypothetical protein
MNIRMMVILLSVMVLILGAAFSSECNAAIKVGIGWSVNTDETKAVNEALVMLRKSVKTPNFVFILNESAYDDNVVIKTLNNSLKNTKIFGYEVSFAVFTQEGIHRGAKGSLALMGIEAGEWAVGVGGTDMSAAVTVDDIQKTATKAIETAIQNAGKKRGDVPSVVLLAPTKLKEEPILDAVRTMFGKDVKVMGGTPGSPMVFANDQVIDNGFALAVLYANTKVGVGYHSGVQTGIRMDKKLSGVVTAMGKDSRTLKEINGRPAFDVYNEWSEGRFDYIDIKNLKEPFAIWKTSGRNPLVKKYDLGDGKFGTNVTIPAKVLPDHSIIIGTDHKVGETLYYAVGTKRAYVKRAGAIVNHALVNGRIKKKNLIGGIHAYCRGAAFGQLGKEVSKLEPLVSETKKEMNGMPFIGGFTAGEQGNIPGHGCFHGNLSSSMVVFSEE